MSGGLNDGHGVHMLFGFRLCCGGLMSGCVAERERREEAWLTGFCSDSESAQPFFSSAHASTSILLEEASVIPLMVWMQEILTVAVVAKLVGLL